MSYAIARDQLRAIVERVERLHEERKAIADDIREIYAEAKGSGYDVATIKEVVKIRGKDRNEWAEKSALLDMYLHALGMIDGAEASRVHVHVREEDTEHEPQPSPMAGKAAASTSPEVAAGNSEAGNPTSTDGETGMVLGTGKERPLSIGLHTDGDPEERFESASLHQYDHQSSDLHDGRLQAVPAPALDESRDSAAGVEAPAAPVNPRCLKHQRGEECKFSHKRYSCAGCNQAAELQRAGAA